MAVHVVTGHQVARGHPDHHVVLLDLFAGRDGAGSDLVAGRHLCAGAQVEFGGGLAQGDRRPGDQQMEHHVRIGTMRWHSVTRASLSARASGSGTTH